MKALLIVNKYSEPVGFCPICNKFADEIIFEGYVDKNIYLSCSNHCEVLLCISNYYYDNGLKQLENNTINNNCSIRLNYNEFNDYIKENKIDIDNLNHSIYFKDIPNNNYYLVGVMNLKKIVQVDDVPDDFDETNNEDYISNICETKGINIDVISFSELDESINSDHYGPSLYYEAICTECNKKSYSRIWGD